ncbi:MAG: hypothetical protein BMS9Abin13_173 [Patescibacteria group bacterium]|nr:MAG: hypothetical protein BMS9Abin13_173 [Patescibacteria group bacterium]
MWYLLGVLFLANTLIWFAVFQESRDSVLTVAFLDVGQGDAIFIEAPDGTQVLLDGGPGGSVLRQLGEVMPFYDRSIDMVIASHPDQDHTGGLPAVLERFDIGVVMGPGVGSDTAVYKEFEGLVREQKIQKVMARRGMRVVLGGGVYMDILFPDRDTFGWDTNNASIIARLVYGNVSFLLTGDAPKRIEEYVVALEGERLNADILKLGHHGSKTSTSEVFLGIVSPQYAIISAGVDNRYGHPHKEVTDMLKEFDILSLATYESGTIVIKSDGENIYVK